MQVDDVLERDDGIVASDSLPLMTLFSTLSLRDSRVSISLSSKSSSSSPNVLVTIDGEEDCGDCDSIVV